MVLITGPRQVGKSTLVQALGKVEDPSRVYVSLDTIQSRATAQEDPELFLRQHPPPVTVDEVQHAPQLLDAIKPRVDREKERGAYWLTGSQSFPLMQQVSESLAGRVGILSLSGLSAAEEAGLPRCERPFRPDRLGDLPSVEPTGVEALFQRIVRGSFPRLAHPDPPPWEGFYNSYVQTYIERDVRSLMDVANLATFQRFVRLAAARIGQLLNFADLARDAGVSPGTAQQWMRVLEATHQVYLLRPYFENVGKRQIKSPKLYFRDTGLAAFLTGWTSPQAAAGGVMAGAFLENYVLTELLKSYENRGRAAPLWFYRTREGQEVDFLLAEDGLLFPLEVKLSATPNRRHLRGIRSLARTGAPLGSGAVLCLVEEPYPLDRSVMAVPVAAIR